jgi:hypothetical protein
MKKDEKYPIKEKVIINSCGKKDYSFSSIIRKTGSDDDWN